MKDFQAPGEASSTPAQLFIQKNYFFMHISPFLIHIRIQRPSEYEMSPKHCELENPVKILLKLKRFYLF